MDLPPGNVFGMIILWIQPGGEGGAGDSHLRGIGMHLQNDASLVCLSTRVQAAMSPQATSHSMAGQVHNSVTTRTTPFSLRPLSPFDPVVP